jgi:hypothetical protein
MFWVLSQILGSGSSNKFAWFLAVINIVAAVLGRFWPKPDIFEPGNPMPKKHDKVEPGEELWKLILFFEGKLHASEYNGAPCKEVNFWFGPFRFVRFFISVQQETIEKNVFVFRGKRAARRVRKAAIDTFGSPDKHINPVETFVWSNINGFMVRITPTIYEVCRRPSKSKRKPSKRTDKK